MTLKIINMKNIISSESLVPVIKAEKNNHGADFTVKSLRTEKEYTYSISRKQYKGMWFTFVSVETGYQVFKKLGHYFKGNLYLYKSGAVVDVPSAKAIAFVLNKVEQNNFEFLKTNVEIMHTGNCLRCGRTLTDSHSIEIGLGPVCVNI